MIRPIQPRPGPKAESTAIPPTLGLESLAAHEVARIDSLLGPETLKRRLMEIGFVPGSAVRFEMATPFGDPLIFSLRGSKIALRRNEAQCVRFTR
jgi:ferrous iron transport protein A